MIYLGIAAVIFFGELLVKNYMEEHLEEREVKKKLKGLLWLRKHHNEGAFLNLGERSRPVVAVLSLGLTVFLTIYFMLTLGKKGNVLLKTGLALLCGGAFSNTYDRMRRNYVMDYFSFGCKKLSNVIWNISDMGIIIGSLLVVLAAEQEQEELSSAGK